MALIFNDTNLLSKVKIGEATYNLKDAQSREKLTTLIGEHDLEALGAAAWKAVATEIGENDDLPTARQIKSYVDSTIAVQKFDVVVLSDTQDLPTASEDTFHKIYLKPNGKVSGSYVEYITIRTNEGTTEEPVYKYAWEQIGTTETDLSGYVKKTQKIATLDLNDDITTKELQTALELKALAYKDNAATTVTDYATGIKGVSYTPGGNINVTLKDAATATEAALTKMDYTPSGSVTGTVTPTGSISMKKTTDNSGTQISGSVSTPTISVNLNTDTIQPVNYLGKLAEYEDGSWTDGTVADPTTQFATEGITVAVDTADSELLVFATATKNAAVVKSDITMPAYTAPTYTQGELPTLGTAKTFATTVNSATSTQPTFTGDYFASTFSGGTDNISASFSGTKVEKMVVNKVEYKKQEVDTKTFTGTEATIAPELKTGSKIITVE